MPRLRRADTSRPGWTIRRRGRGFTLLDEDGNRLSGGEERDRVSALVIPPAWKLVWVSPHPNDHIQACGTDADGRRQYIYHEAWQRSRARAKYERSLELAALLPQARSQVTRALRSTPKTQEWALAVAFRLLDSAHLRVGSERYAEQYGSRGLTTLDASHARVSGDVVTLEFLGKSGVWWESRTEDADLAAAIRLLKRRGPEARLLAWNEGSEWHNLRAEDVNNYVRLRTGGDFTAKDFRTLHGTVVAATFLADAGVQSSEKKTKDTISAAVLRTAEVLGNTPAVARTSYVDPRVFDLFRQGVVIDTGSGSAERALRRLLLQG